MKIRYKNRLIQPGNSRFTVLYKLRRANKPVDVYDIASPGESVSYRSIHDLMWKLHRQGYVIYGRSRIMESNVMVAEITLDGGDWVLKKIYGVLVGAAIAIGAVGTILHFFD